VGIWVWVLGMIPKKCGYLGMGMIWVSYPIPNTQKKTGYGCMPITDLFNLCLETNTIPDEWKISYITPIHKGKGSKSQVDKYRPILILPPLAKIFEKLISA
jgi:hypothetical protein